MTTRTDAQLIAAAAADPAAFRELYERYAPRIHGYLRRRTGDDEAAYDLTAETFAQAWLMRRRFRDELGGNAGPWLYAIARNTLLMSVRRARVEQRACRRIGLTLAPGAGSDAGSDAATDAGGTPLPATPSEHWLEGLDEALDALPQSQREALRLRVEEDLAYEQVADALGTTPQAARVRVHRAITTLRRRLTNSIEVTP